MAGLRLGNSCMVFRLPSDDATLAVGDRLMVETDAGEEHARVVYLGVPEHREESRPYPGRIRRIVRRLEEKELELAARLEEKEREARLFCREQIKALGLEMRLSKVVYTGDNNRAVFYFTADQRVDFRELVRILARRLRIRVEMRQIGVRDEAGLLGGLGSCGEVLCCTTYLKTFRPVSVRMAKNQELSLNPDAISGCCGRLMCCLGYENQVYQELRESLPRPNHRLWTSDGREVVVKGVQPLKRQLTCQLPEGGGRVTFDADQLSRTPPGEAGERDAPPLAVAGAKERNARTTGEERPAPPPGEPVTEGADDAGTGGERPRSERESRGKRRRRRSKGEAKAAPAPAAVTAKGNAPQQPEAAPEDKGRPGAEGEERQREEGDTQRTGGRRRSRRGRSRRRSKGGGEGAPPGANAAGHSNNG